MKILCITLIILIIVILLLITYFNAYNKINDINNKILKADDKITKNLNEKKECMDFLVEKINKNSKKKNYLKDYEKINIDNYTNQELDEELNKFLTTIINYSEDHKDLNKDEYNKKLKSIKLIDQNILASKKYFNKNNNELIKLLKGYYKVIANVNNIKVKTSYETKEPISTNL